MKEINIKKAHYLKEYKVRLIFNDNNMKIVDFGDFLRKKNHPAFDKYKKLTHFRKFKLSMEILFGETIGG